MSKTSTKSFVIAAYEAAVEVRGPWWEHDTCDPDECPLSKLLKEAEEFDKEREEEQS